MPFFYVNTLWVLKWMSQQKITYKWWTSMAHTPTANQPSGLFRVEDRILCILGIRMYQSHWKRSMVYRGKMLWFFLLISLKSKDGFIFDLVFFFLKWLRHRSIQTMALLIALFLLLAFKLNQNFNRNIFPRFFFRAPYL